MKFPFLNLEQNKVLTDVHLYSFLYALTCSNVQADIVFSHKIAYSLIGIINHYFRFSNRWIINAQKIVTCLHKYGEAKFRLPQVHGCPLLCLLWFW